MVKQEIQCIVDCLGFYYVVIVEDQNEVTFDRSDFIELMAELEGFILSRLHTGKIHAKKCYESTEHSTFYVKLYGMCK